MTFIAAMRGVLSGARASQSMSHIRSSCHPLVRTPFARASKGVSSRVFSSVAQETVTTVSKSDKYVGYWLLGCCGTVFGTVVLGGVTRLTESGLSITEWNPIKGVKPPTTREEWKHEFELYKQYPEFNCNKNMTLEDFKRIWYMEYLHRMWGRAVGAVFVIPAVAFWMKGWIRPQFKKPLLAFGALIGFQGALGWYMVKSGLDHDPKGAHVPRVSHYRLMAHLGSAFLLYAGMFSVALKHVLPPNPSMIPFPAKLRGFAVGVSHLVFLTALSGALVAGLDAGLIYNSFPKMGAHWVPPEYLEMTPAYKNMFDNQSTVQFNHRVLGITTFGSVIGLWAVSRGLALPPRARIAVNAVLAIAVAQVTLGISTLLYFVPTELAAAHQAGSLTLLTAAMWLVQEIKKIPK